MATRTPSFKEMKYKQVLMVREQPPNFEMMINQANRQNIKTWCCIDQGFSEITGRFEKNLYCPNEHVKADAIINNSGCQLNMSGIRLAIEQEVTIRCGGHSFKEMYTLAEKQEQGVLALCAEPQYRFIEIDLNTVKYTPRASHNKKGVNKPYSQEDIFMMSQAQPASHGNIVKNEYFIAIRTEYSGCTCCASLPTARIPLVILPMINPACYGFQAPTDFVPQEQPMY
jgi:hypothetical protein